MFSPPHIGAPIIRFLLFVCPLHLSVSFICRRASFRPWSKSRFHGLPSPKVEIAYPPLCQPSAFKRQTLSSRNVKSIQSQSHFSPHNTPLFFVFVFLEPTCSVPVSLFLFLTSTFSEFFVFFFSLCVATVHRRVQKCSLRSRVMSLLTFTFQIREILINAECSSRGLWSYQSSNGTRSDILHMGRRRRQRGRRRWKGERDVGG